MFELQGKPYLLVIDYFSRYIEIAKLIGTQSKDIIEHLKSIFARHGIPEVLMSDNGPQYSSAIFSKFTKEYNFQHITSSPKFPRSNGEAERAVRTMKELLKKAPDPYIALLSYRATPLQNGCSPSELLMGRRLRTTIPCHPTQLAPAWPNMQQVRKHEEHYKSKQKANFDLRHRAIDSSQLQQGTNVFIPDMNTEGFVTKEAGFPRSVIVNTPKGEIRRNQADLKPIPIPVSQQEETAPATQNSETPTRVELRRSTRSNFGKPPEKMDL